MDLRQLLPAIVFDRARPAPWADRLVGTVLFSDVSGFTPLSESLAPLGAEGAERLTDILNRYFAAMIGIVHRHGGEVMKFGGDAILCFFPETGQEPAAGPGDPIVPGGDGRRASGKKGGTGSLGRAVAAAGAMQAGMVRFRSIPTPGGRTALGMKVGLACGEVLLGGVGDPGVRCDYFFAGRPVDLATEAEHRARAGEIVLAGPGSAGPRPEAGAERIGPGFWRLGPGAPEGGIRGRRGEPAPPPSSAAPGMPADAAAYLIREVVDRALEPGGSELGALRDLVPVFLQFQGFDFAPGRLDLARFHAFFSAVMELTHRYLGRLNRISMGDKGSTFLVLFGAPAPIEKAELLAAQWGVELLDRVRTEFPGVTLRAGLHTGRAFTGIVGGDGRWDYTVMGDAVNTAARLMGEAGDGGVAVSEPFRKRTSGAFEFADGGERALKGKQKTVRVHYLLGRRERDLRRAAPRAIGRERELGRLHEFLAGVRGGEPRLALLAGEAGTGTSLLAAQLAEEAGAGGWLAVIGRGEITTASHPYGPWMDLLRALLFGCLEPTAGALRERMARAGLDWGADGPTLRRFFGLPGGAGSAGDPAAEQRRTHDLLARLILDAARRRPTLLWLDDLHWFDSLSIELLRVLLGRFKDEPLAVLASTRPCPAAEALGGAFATGRTLTLGPLDAAGVRALAEERLEGEAREDLVGFLLARAAGNPFFTDRLIAYLREAELLDRRPDGWTAARRASELRLETGGEIVAAAVERLPASCRLHLQWAACMGPTIDPVVLERALGGRWDPSALEHLLDRGVLVREGPRRVRFAQGVLQEALYAAQLARVRQAAHRRIGRAMEEVAGEDASAMAPNLSNHYFLGGIRDRAAVHALAAARALWASGSYPEAHRFFARAWALRRRRGGDDRWEAGVWTGRAALAAGRMGEGLAHVRAFRRAALRAGRSREAEEALLQEFHLRHRQGDQGYAGHARRLARSGAAPHGRARELAYLIGAARFRQGRYEEARSWLRQAARSGRAGARESALSALLFLASIEKQGRRWGAALAALRRGMALAGRAGLEAARLKFVMEEANLLIERGAPADGRRLLMDSLPAIERTGDAYLLAVTLLNLGFLELQTGSVDAADRSLEEASRLFGNLGVPNGRAKALMNRGIGAFSGGRPDEAIRFYVEATRSYEGLGEEVEAVYGYYNLAEACLALGRTEEAEAWVRKAEAHGRVRADAALRGLFEGLRRQLGRS